jgi:pantoate--beta-alanine ligase
MVRDLNLDIEVVPCEIVREKSGLALSSRNLYLSESAHTKASQINQILKTFNNLTNLSEEERVAQVKQNLEQEFGETTVEYLCHLPNLLTKADNQKGSVLAVAVRVENVRLIDNIEVEG